MSKDRIRQIIQWITAVLILVMAVLLVLSCFRIYRSGDRPFNRETVAAYGARLAIPGYGCLVFTILGLFLRDSGNSAKAQRDDSALLHRYHEVLPAADAEVKKRRLYRWATGGMIAVLTVYPVIYYCDADHFSVTDLNTDIIRAVLVALIPTLISLSLMYLCGHLERQSISREIAVRRASGEKPGRATGKRNMNSASLTAIRTGILVLAVIFIALGVANGGAEGVLGKAIRICTECIGLG